MCRPGLRYTSMQGESCKAEEQLPRKTFYVFLSYKLDAQMVLVGGCSQLTLENVMGDKGGGRLSGSQPFWQEYHILPLHIPWTPLQSSSLTWSAVLLPALGTLPSLLLCFLPHLPLNWLSLLCYVTYKSCQCRLWHACHLLATPVLGTVYGNEENCTGQYWKISLRSPNPIPCDHRQPCSKHLSKKPSQEQPVWPLPHTTDIKHPILNLG